MCPPLRHPPVPRYTLAMEKLAIRCDHCGSPVPEGEIDRALSLAHCPGCEHVFQWGPTLVGTPQSLPAPPPGVEVSEEDGLVLTWRWLAWQYVVLAVFAVVWNIATFSFSLTGGPHPLMWVHLLGGFVMAYVAAGGLVNASTFRFADGHLTVTHGPLPWPNAADVPLSEIRQVCCRRMVKRGKNGEVISYDIEVLSGTRILKVLTGMRDIVQAHWIERRIEAHLRIADQPLAGEAPKG